MDRILVRGSTKPLEGSVSITGAKNATLPLMIASLLSDQPLTLRNVPELTDVTALQQLLGELGADITFWGRNEHARSGGGSGERTISIQLTDLNTPFAPYDMVRKMRASFWVLGPMLAREGSAKVSLPGGCAIGTRPVGLHLDGLKSLGADIEVEGGYVIAKAPAHGLVGNKINMEFPSVGATVNIVLAASLARGTTVINNAAKEPEITALCDCLSAMGAFIEGAGTSTIIIEGRETLGAANMVVPADRIEAGTYAIAAAMTGGKLRLDNADASQMKAVIDIISQTGAIFEIDEKGLTVSGSEEIIPISAETAPYPGFPTDLQAQLMALLSLAKGKSTIRETIFENRFMHVQELVRLGADIALEHDCAHINGVSSLTGAPVMATDLRASVCLVLSGLVAKGETVISRVYHLDRGFSRLERKLSNCGADIERLHS